MKCDLRKTLNSECHKPGFSRKQRIVKLKDLPCEEQEEKLCERNTKKNFGDLKEVCGSINMFLS